MPVYNVPTAASVATGTYSGNQTENRAIPHTLPSTPKFVFISCGNYRFFLCMNENGMISVGSTIETKGVTKPDGTNFYVGIDPSWTTSANLTGEAYYWYAIT